MFTIKINGENLSFDKKVKLLDLTNGDKKYICARVNNHIRELDYEVYYDANVQLLTLEDDDSKGQYRRAIIFLFLNAAHEIMPETRFKISYSVSRCLFARDILGTPITIAQCKAIEEKMHELVDCDYPFIKEIVPNEEAIKYYSKLGQLDKIEILKYRPEKTVHFYNCNGYKNYLFGHMVPSTGYIKKFSLKNYYPGIIIQFPSGKSYAPIEDFKEEPNFARSLTAAGNWCKQTNLGLVSQINNYSEINKGRDLINITENKCNRDIVHLGDEIEKRIHESRMICIAGPSSSGKTTFANRLCDELKSRGFNPIRISLDDYYHSHDHIPHDENGDLDFEHIDALDKELFNQNMLDLLNGKEVALPKYDFKTNEKTFKDSISIANDQPIIVEGIHALNEKMSNLIPKANKFKIFIAPQVQLNLDYDNPISMTDIRLLRRIVRDNKYRNTTADETIKMWPSVRRGEFKWIYETQEEADYVFDSFLVYEPCVLRKFALPILKQIDHNSDSFHIADRLMRFLKYFKDVDSANVPCNSLLCEFIGGSSYE